MASPFSLPSRSVNTFSSPKSESRATATGQPSTRLSDQPSDITKSCQEDMSQVSSLGSNQECPDVVFHYHLAVETSEKTSTASAVGSLPGTVWKFSSQCENKTDDVILNVVDTKTLVATNGEESAKDETKRSEKRKQIFPTFSSSLGRDKIEADLLAMCGSKRSKKSTEKKRTTSVQKSFQDDLSSFSADDNSSDSMGSCFNLVVDQTLVSTEFVEPGKVEISENKEKASHAVNQTISAAEPIQPDSTQLGFGTVPLIKENGKKKKRTTFSTFSVSLTREKIEADISAMCGSTRSRRIKKRPKSVQRRLDDLFPGLRLKFITADDYRVCDDKNLR